MSEKGKGKKKEKVVYIDDGRTIADMSGVDRGASRFFSDTPSYSSFKDKWLTFWDAFRMMLLPTLVFGGALALLFGIMWLLFKLM